MTYLRVDELRQRWDVKGVLSAFESELERVGFSDDYVSRVIQRGDGPRASTKSKVIKDGIWGMIEVGQSCLRLLDSPILQHLRGVRQNGFSYLTYPPAEHTRFAHSLGMMCVVSRFLQIVSDRPNEGVPPTAGFQVWQPGTDWTNLLQHAALLHDVGHMPFSHVTESAIEADPTAFRCGHDLCAQLSPSARF